MEQLIDNALACHNANSDEAKAAARLKFYTKDACTTWGLAWAPDVDRIQVTTPEHARVMP